jgi:hypothetical protein
MGDLADQSRGMVGSTGCGARGSSGCGGEGSTGFGARGSGGVRSGRLMPASTRRGGPHVEGLIIYLGMIALMLWVGYLIMRTAVKKGILRADVERASRQFLSAPPQNGGRYPPQGPPNV